MPVLPEVGSTSTERPGSISPAASAASTIARPIRSLTEPSGLKNSSFSTTVASRPSSRWMRGMRTIGVAPMVCRMLSWMQPRAGATYDGVTGAGVTCAGATREGAGAVGRDSGDATRRPVFDMRQCITSGNRGLLRLRRGEESRHEGHGMLIRRDRAMVAVTVMLDVAFHSGRAATVSAADIAGRLGMARRGMEPLLQALSRAGLLDSVRGPRGGYRLGRPRRDVSLSDIVAAATADEADAGDGPGGRLQAAVIDALWNELDAAATTRLAALTLDDLMRRAAAAGMRRPVAEPISFAI